MQFATPFPTICVTFRSEDVLDHVANLSQTVHNRQCLDPNYLKAGSRILDVRL